MATAEYFVNVNNESNDTQNYLFFNQQPEESTGVGTIYSNVWIRAPGVGSPSGKAKFDVKVANYAVCGTTPAPVDYGVVVSTSDEAPVELTGTKPGTVPVMDIVQGGPQFIEPYETTKRQNSFGIHTKAFDPDRYTTVYVGYGKFNDNGEVVPVAVWRAKPNKTYQLTPRTTYYVGTGEYMPGAAVDITELGPVATIDFTYALSGQTIATVVHHKDGSYSDPVFSYPEKKKPYSAAM